MTYERAYHRMRDMAREIVKARNGRQKNPGKWFREGMSLPEFFRMFPDDDAAEEWFAKARWGAGHVACPFCGAMDDRIARCKDRKPQPYRCRDCRKHFSVKTASLMHNSQLGCQIWLLAIYLLSTNLKGVSSMRLHREMGITQKAAWHLAHRIRKAMEEGGFEFDGPVEVDETYIGGKRKNMHSSRRKKLTGRGTFGKIAVVGAYDRATGQVAIRMEHFTDRATLHAFIEDHVRKGAMVFSDDAKAYRKMNGYRHRSVKHSVGEFVRGITHTNSIESFWGTFKRGYLGAYHKMSIKHLPRYIAEFQFRHNNRILDTARQMERVAAKMGNVRLPREKLTSGPPAWPKLDDAA